jgi:hypothetical protein
MLLGSVSGQVSAYAQCPTVIVPALLSAPDFSQSILLNITRDVRMGSTPGRRKETI